MRYLILCTAIAFFTGCAGGYEKAEDPQDAGREFIRASLDGDYKKAIFFLHLKDLISMPIHLYRQPWTRGLPMQ